MHLIRLIAFVAAIVAGISLALLLSGKRVLISEKKVSPGESYFVSDYGDLGKSQHAHLVCQYFTGRSLLTRVFWHSPNNIMGRDQCPFLIGEED
jgi:hypothetical protein